MVIPLALLVAMATIGSVDGLYYHLYKFRLYRQPSSRVETGTHVVRALTLSFATALLSTWEPHGGWFWALAAVFALDLVDDVVDVSIEPRSRAPLGGLPPTEYLIHMVVMGLSGGAWATYLALGWAKGAAPTALVPLAPGAVPWWLVGDARLIAVGSLALGLLEAGLLALNLGAVPERRAA